MSLSEVYRDRYYNSGYVYIAGSLSGRVLKIGVTINIYRLQAYLRNRRYGSIGDWVLLYYVHVDSGGRVEHDARRLLERYRQITWYEKDGSLQRGREIVKCSFGRALEASESAIDAYLMFGLAEAKALIIQHRAAVLAVANALIIHRTLDAVMIHEIIARAPERARRAAWKIVEKNAADFAAYGSKG